MGKLTKWIDNLTIQVMRITRWHIPIVMILIVQEVVLRYVFLAPTIWGGDLSVMISAIGRMIGIGYATLFNTHIIMDLFTHNLPFRRAKILKIFNSVVFTLPLFGVIIYMTYIRAGKFWLRKETIYSLWKPVLWPVVYLLVVCYSLALIQEISQIIKDVISLQKGSDEWIKDR